MTVSVFLIGKGRGLTVFCLFRAIHWGRLSLHTDVEDFYIGKYTLDRCVFGFVYFCFHFKFLVQLESVY